MVIVEEVRSEINLSVSFSSKHLPNFGNSRTCCTSSSATCLLALVSVFLKCCDRGPPNAPRPPNPPGTPPPPPPRLFTDPPENNNANACGCDGMALDTGGMNRSTSLGLFNFSIPMQKLSCLFTVTPHSTLAGCTVLIFQLDWN